MCSGCCWFDLVRVTTAGVLVADTDWFAREGGGCDGENGLVGGEYGSWRGCSALVGTGMYGKDESEEGGLKNENRRAKN